MMPKEGSIMGKKAIIQPGTCGFMQGRFNPPQKAHVFIGKWVLEEKVEKLVIGISSSFEWGNERHLFLAYQREKMFAKSLRDAGVDMSRVIFLHIPDCTRHEDKEKNWDEWWEQNGIIFQKYNITHYITGNSKDILEPLAKRNLQVPFEIINPEKWMPKKYRFPYHASDMREAMARGDYAKVLEIAASGTVDFMGIWGGFTLLREVLDGRGKIIVPGRQAVDLIVTCFGRVPSEIMVACGRRAMWKECFPGCLGLSGGGIDDFENPLDAAVREGIEELGLPIVILNRYAEPTHVLVGNQYICEMRFVGLFGSPNPELGGNQGGSSQVFHIHVNTSWKNLASFLRSESDLDEVAFRPVLDVLQEGLAYQQSDMLRKALQML